MAFPKAQSSYPAEVRKWNFSPLFSLPKVLPALLQKLVGEFFWFFAGKFGKFSGKFGGNFLGIFSDPQNKGSKFSGKISEHFSCENSWLGKKSFEQNSLCRRATLTKGVVRFGVKFWWNFPCYVFQGLGVRREISPKCHVKNGVKNGKFHAKITLLGQNVLPKNCFFRLLLPSWNKDRLLESDQAWTLLTVSRLIN